MHLTRHMDVEPFTCTICGKSFSKSRQASVDPHEELHFGLILCLLVWQLWIHLLDTVNNALDQKHGRQALHVHYLWKELQLGGRHQNSYLPQVLSGCLWCWADLFGAKRKTLLDNTPFALFSFAPTA